MPQKYVTNIRTEKNGRSKVRFWNDTFSHTWKLSTHPPTDQLQNRAARIITDTRQSKPSNEILENLGWHKFLSTVMGCNLAALTLNSLKSEPTIAIRFQCKLNFWPQLGRLWSCFNVCCYQVLWLTTDHYDGIYINQGFKMYSGTLL